MPQATSAGWEGQHGDTGQVEQLEKPSSSRRESGGSWGPSYNRESPGKWADDETVADGSGVARKAGTCRRSQGTRLLVLLSPPGRQGRLITAPSNLQDHALEDLRPGEGRCDGRRWSRRELVAPRRKRSPSRGPITPGAKRAGKRSAGNPHAPLCVQSRLARSVGDSPTGVTARRPVAWMVGGRETQPRKPIDTAIFGMASESPGRTARERRGGPESAKPRRPSPQRRGEGRMTRRRLAGATGHSGGVGATAR